MHHTGGGDGEARSAGCEEPQTLTAPGRESALTSELRGVMRHIAERTGVIRCACAEVWEDIGLLALYPRFVKGGME
jgi:hypothetical protein